MRLNARHILLGLAVTAYVLGASTGSVPHGRLSGITVASQRLATAENSRPSDSKPVWSQGKYFASLTKDEFHPATPLLPDQLPHHQEFKILPRPSGVLLPLRCVYVRYWPRDPPSA